jgi:hypothetical protein
MLGTTHAQCLMFNGFILDPDARWLLSNMNLICTAATALFLHTQDRHITNQTATGSTFAIRNQTMDRRKTHDFISQ